MKAKQTKQKCPQKALNIGMWITLIIGFAMGILLIFEAIQGIRVLNNSDSRGILEYQGGFTCFKKEYARNTNYVFTLNNGDVIKVPCEYIDGNIEDLENFSKLVFRYSARKSVLNNWKHTGIAILTLDGKHVFLREEFTRGTIQTTVVVYFLIGGPIVLLSVLPMLKVDLFMRFLSFVKKIKYYNRRKKKGSNPV